MSKVHGNGLSNGKFVGIILNNLEGNYDGVYNHDKTFNYQIL